MKIDVHCLIHKKSPWTQDLLTQMAGEDCNFFPVQNGQNIGAGRVVGFSQGNSPYVSYVDYDDLIQPGIFSKLNSFLSSNPVDWLYTDEMLIDETGGHLAPGWSSHPNFYPPEVLEVIKIAPDVYCNHLLVIKRDIISLPVAHILLQLNEIPELYLFRELQKHPNFFHFGEVGYYWRQHEDSGYRKSFLWKFLTSDLKEGKEDG